jgi:hypothetical protein
MSATNSDKRPTHNVFAVLENDSRREDAKDKWVKIGGGWLNSDGSTTLLLDTWPLAWSAGYRGKFKVIVQEVRDDNNSQRQSSRDRGRR